MKIVLLSGGSGKRLWPVSNDSRSKQFLKVLKSETDELESMAQRVWRQLKKKGKVSYMAVHHFVEKPKEAQANLFIEQGALWNCGVFAFKLNYMLTLLENKGYSVNYEKMVNLYGQLPKISFDYEVVEKANHVVVYPYEGGWKVTIIRGRHMM